MKSNFEMHAQWDISKQTDTNESESYVLCIDPSLLLCVESIIVPCVK